MKAPLVIMIIIVVGILGFLVIYSQQHEMTAQVNQEKGAAGGGYGTAPKAGGYGTPPAAGGYGAPKAGGYGAPPKAGGYGAPSSGGYGK